MKFNLTKTEERIFKRLNTPAKIQDFLNKIPVNFEKSGETILSPREVLKQNKAHCFEGVLLASAILWHHGKKPLLLDLIAEKPDLNHVVAVFKENGYWGAISKTNHAVLRYREPVYKTVRELVMSYFHEYFTDNGKKTLKSFAGPINLSRFGKKWVTSEAELWFIDKALDKTKHRKILRPKKLRRADKIEIKAGKLTDW